MRMSLFNSVVTFILLTTFSVESPGQPYFKVNRDDLPFVFSSILMGLVVDATGNTLYIDGMIKEFSLDGNKIELESGILMKTGNEVFFLTKTYGKIKVSFDSKSNSTIWLTASQAQRFMELRKDNA